MNYVDDFFKSVTSTILEFQYLYFIRPKGPNLDTATEKLYARIKKIEEELVDAVRSFQRAQTETTTTNTNNFSVGPRGNLERFS